MELIPVDAVERLEGGMGNDGQVVRISDTVRRPAASTTPALLALLNHLAAVGFPAPNHLGRDDLGRDVFGWLEGDVAAQGDEPWGQTDDGILIPKR